MMTVAMLVSAIPSTSAARPPRVSRNPTPNGLSSRAHNGLPPRSLGTVASAMTAPVSGAAASVPAAGLAASGAGEGVPSVMGHTLGPGSRAALTRRG